PSPSHRDATSGDPFRAACPEIDENSSEARRPLDMITRVSEATECTPLVIHHARKPVNDAPGGAKMSMRGSSGLFDAAASVMIFEGAKRKGEPATLKHEKARISGKLQPDFGLVVRDVFDGQGRFDGVEVVTTSAASVATGGAPKKAKDSEIQAAILEAVRGGPLGANRLEVACRASGLEFTAAAFRRC